MRFKTMVERILRKAPPLFRLGSRVYHGMRGSFRSLSAGGPEAVRSAFRSVKEQREPPGDYYEFGLFRGYTFLQAFKACTELGLQETRFYGFDSFEGLPPVEEVDKGRGEFFEGQFACSRAKVERNLRRHGMDLSRAALIEGFYDQVLSEELRGRHPFRRASVVLFDCDLYASTRVALGWMAPYLDDRTLLLFDDWYSFGNDPDKGQPRALDEFIREDGRFVPEPLWDFPSHGRAFRLRAA